MNQLHHAYLLEGSLENARESIEQIAATQLGVEVTETNPDFLVRQFETFGIDESRALKELAELRPIGAAKVLIVALSSITTEAQNALLKLFEDPTPHTHFFLVVPASSMLLGTLRSRLYLLNGIVPAVEKELGEQFLCESNAERLKQIEPIIKNKDKGEAITLIDSIEYVLHSRNVEESAVALTVLLRLRRFIRDRSASLKMILETLALALPQLNAEKKQVR